MSPAEFVLPSSEQVGEALRGQRPPRQGRVLIVESHPDRAAILRAAFAEAGWEVATAKTLSEARTAFSREACDVALLDHLLADGPGDSLLAPFLLERPDCLCLMMTDDPQPAQILDWTRRGATDCLPKPVDPRLVLERCHRARSERRVLALEGQLDELASRLQVGEQRLQAILDHSPNVAVQMYDGNGRVTYWNPAAETLYGWKTGEVMGRTLDDFLLGPEEFAEFRHVFADCARTGQPYGPYEILTQRKDGSEAWVLATTFAIPSAGGEPAFVCMDVDVTKLKLAQADAQAKHEELRRRQEELKTLLRFQEHMLDATCVWVDTLDMAGRVTLWNRAAEAISGYSREEVLGNARIWEWLYPDPAYRQEVFARAEDILREGDQVEGFENTIRHKDGQNRIVSWYSNSMSDAGGAPMGSIALGIDVTERKEQALQIQREREWSANLLKLAPDLVLGLGEGGQILLFNQFAETLTGYKAGEVLGQSWIDRFIAEEERETVRAVWQDIVNHQRTSHRHENRIVTRSGEERLIRWNNTFISEAGNFRMVLSIGEDVTETRRAEEKRLELERRMLHSQKLESLGVLAGGIAHDFNNLLMAMLGNLELAMLDLSPLSRARAPLDQIESIVHRAADLTRQMLAYSGRGAFQVQPMDLNALVKENVHLFRAVVSRSIAFQLELTPDPAWIHADPGQIQQVIMNLVSNASEAIGNQTGVVTLSTCRRFVEAGDLALSRCSEIPPPGSYVELQVTDTGCGMDAEVLRRIFDPFFTTKFTGRGLGMSAILGIVQGHHGAILMDSAPGRGTDIRVLLPVLADSPEGGVLPTGASKSPSVPERGEAGRGTILLVDDEEVLREMGAVLLERLGYRSLTAADGFQALAILKQPPAGLVGIILDLTMPGLDGLGTLEALRKDHPDLPVLLCSGYDRDETLAKVSDIRQVGFLQKPYRLKELEKALAQLLGTG